MAAEFADELNNLGVRVAALEKKVDNVKWQGMVRYRYINRHEEGAQENKTNNKNTNGLLLRLEPQMTINKNWTAKARIDYNRNTEMDDAKNYGGVANNKVDGFEVDRVWVEGKYSNFLIKLGKFNVKTAADFATTMDYRIAGAEAVIGKDVQVAVRGGRLNLKDSSAFAHGGNSAGPGTVAHYNAANGGETASYIGVEVYNDRAKKFNWGLGWQHVRGEFDIEANTGNLKGIGSNVNIFNVGLGYKFDKNVNLTGVYAFATGIENEDNGGAYDENKYKNTYAFQLNYKGADKAKKGSWGAFVAWRHLGDVATIHPTAKENGPMNGGEEGWEIGVHYTFAKNILGKAQFYSGKELASDMKVNAVWTELGFYF